MYLTGTTQAETFLPIKLALQPLTFNHPWRSRTQSSTTGKICLIGFRFSDHFWAIKKSLTAKETNHSNFWCICLTIAQWNLAFLFSDEILTRSQVKHSLTQLSHVVSTLSYISERISNKWIYKVMLCAWCVKISG